MLKKFGSEWANIKIFLKKFFCLTVPKNSVVEHFTLALIPGTDKVWIRGGGEYQDHLAKFFLSHSAEKFRRESFTVALFPGSGKVWIRVG